MINALLCEIASHGDRGAVIPFSRIQDLRNDMVELRNGEYHTSWLDRMANWTAGDKVIPSFDLKFEPRSLISIIMPSPKAMLQFRYHGKPVHCVVPPHYTNWELKNKQALQYLKNYLTPGGFSVAMAITLPQKLLAVHSGLARYGRNNICYNEEFGSCMQIMTYISDLPCDEGAWFPLSRMEICENCHACVDSCPTGAIDSSRRIVNSDRCITYIDDIPGEEFPEWVDKDAHNSIVGCSVCQDCCPGNAHNKDNITAGVTFTEEETAELVNHKDGVPYTDTLAAKIEAVGVLPEYSETNILSRNLAALLRKA